MQGLRLDRGADALRGSYGGPVIRPGDSGGSKLVRMVSGALEGKLMPPQGDPLSRAEVGVLRAWIDAGAEWPDSDRELPDATQEAPSHWSFQPIANPEPPLVQTKSWPRNEIDQFVLARLEEKGLAPSNEASRETLVRRLSLDLTGLPPTPKQLEGFLAENDPEAYERSGRQLAGFPPLRGEVGALLARPCPLCRQRRI